MRHNIAGLEVALSRYGKPNKRFRALENVIFKNHKTPIHHYIIQYNVAVRTFSSIMTYKKEKYVIGLSKGRMKS